MNASSDAPPFVDELDGAELLDVRPHARARLGDALEQAQRELAADHRRDLDRPPRLVGEAIEAGDEHVLDRVGDGDLGEVAREDDVPSSRRSEPSSSSERVTSSTKKGLPSALAAMRLRRVSGISAVPRSEPVTAAISGADSGRSDTRTTYVRSPNGCW
jgi:hypothetical protein